MSEEEKSYYLNLLKPIFVSKGCYALFIDIQSGLVDAYHSLWGNCFVEAWCESAKGALEDLYNAYTRSLDSEPFDDKHLLTALMFYPVIVAAIQKINPTQDLIEENNRIALMRFKKEELERERIAAEERTDRERIAAEERAERERIAATNRRNWSFLLYGLSLYVFFMGHYVLYINHNRDNAIEAMSTSIVLLLINLLIYIFKKKSVKSHLVYLIFVIAWSIGQYYNTISYHCTFKCPYCQNNIEVTIPYFVEHESREECEKCHYKIIYRFERFLFCKPEIKSTQIHDYFHRYD